MAIIKETKYLIFKSYNIPNKKTKIIEIINKSSSDVIGEIQWYGAWRQYCFMPERFEFDTVWNNTCLADIISVIDILMKERQVTKPIGE